MALLNNKRIWHGPYDKAIDRAKLVSSGQKNIARLFQNLLMLQAFTFRIAARQ